MSRHLMPFALVVVLAAPAAANTGVAFVHGTSDHDDAYTDYWDQEFVDSVIQGLPDPNNWVVINCNFDQYAWHADASGCLARQLLQFVNQRGITDLVVNTHSYGGVVMRWILSNPTMNPRYQQIIDVTRWVNAIAATNLGTPLADAVMDGNVFEEIVGWILGYQSDAVELQQVDWMAFYNGRHLLGTEGRPELPAAYYSVVGTDVDSSPFDPDSYCGGYFENVGLEVTQAWLDSCSDGFIDCTSQAGAGTVWFYDVDVTAGSEPLSHNQSRRPCFGLDTILRDDL